MNFSEDNKPPFDRSILIPIFIGFMAVLGICFILLVSGLSTPRVHVQSGQTNTPVKYQYLGTEPGVVTVQPLEAFTPSPSLTLPPPSSDNMSSTSTSSLVVLTAIVTESTTTPTPGTATTQPLGVSYDDVNSQLTYTGNWISQTGVTGAYQNTLHTSNTIGNAVQLVFYGEKIQLTYQAGPNLGMVAIKLDTSDGFTLDQAAVDTAYSEWESPVQPLANHTITITHISGNSVNIDSLVVVDLSTPTPTVTPTLTR